MDKKIIAEFEIGADTLLKQASETKDIIDILIRQQKKLKDSGDTSSESFVKNASQLKRLKSEYNTYVKSLSVSTSSTDKYNRVQETLTNELNKSGKSIEGVRESNKKLLAIRNQLNLSTKEGLEARTKINKKIDENNDFIKENVSELEKQKINIGNYSESITDALDKTGLFGFSIKGVTNDLKNIITPLSNAVIQTFGLSKAQQGFTSSTSKSTKALRLLKVALISTGIGAIVVAIGALIAGFASTQKGADAISRALAPLKGAFQGIIGVVQQIALNFKSIASGVFGQFKDNFTILVNGFLIGANKMRLAWAKVFGNEEDVKRIQQDILDRQKELTDAVERTINRGKGFVNSVREAGKHISESAIKQREIVDLGIEIEEKENKLIATRAKLLDQLKEQEEIAKNTSLTDAERNEAITKAEQLSSSLADKEKEILDLKIQQKQAQNDLNDTSREDEAELQKLIAERIGKDTEDRARSLKFLGTRNSLQKQAESRRKKAIEDAKKAQQESIKRQEVSLKLFELQRDLEIENSEQRKQLLDDVLQKELAIIDAKEKAGLSEDEAEIERIAARKNAKDKIAQIVEEEKEIERSRLDFKRQLIEQEKILDNQKENLLQSLRNEKRLLEAETEQEQAETQLELANQQAQAKIDNELANLQKEEEAKREQKLQFELENSENELEKQELINEANLEKRERDLEFEEARNLAFLELEKNYQLKKKQLEEKTILAEKIANIENYRERISIAEKGANDLLTISDAIFGKSKAAAIASVIIGRAASIGQIIANTGIANAKAIAASPLTAGQPFVTINTISSALSIGSSVASGAKAISEINAQKAAKGITLQGSSHANGGIGLFDEHGNKVVEAEGGENIYAITNKEASRSINNHGILGALSLINQGIGGGIPLSKPVTFAQSGGMVQTKIQTPLNKNQSNKDIIDGISEKINDIRVINVAEDTINVADESFIVENEANI